MGWGLMGLSGDGGWSRSTGAGCLNTSMHLWYYSTRGLARALVGRERAVHRRARRLQACVDAHDGALSMSNPVAD